MSFVTEGIDTPAQRAEFESLGLKNPFTQAPLRPWRWAVDRERGWYFVSLGGGGEIPWLLRLLNREGVDVVVHGRQRSAGDRLPHAIETWWKLETIRIPRQQAARAAEFLQLIREALEVYGSDARSELNRAVHIKICAPTFI
jgi:hypothetical protein